MAKLLICGKTDIGKKGEYNEDAFLIGGIVENKKELYLEIPLDSSFIKYYGLLVAVADGMGGHNAGDVASGLALNLLSRQFMSSPKGVLTQEEITMALRDSIFSAHKAILDVSRSNPCYSGMGTTIGGVYFTGDGFYTYHAGDSRLYRLRHSGLKQLTKDHSLVQSLIELGQITIEESYAHPQKNVITNCLGGGNSNCEPEVAHNYTAFEGDIFLLCSDGLSDIVDADKIEEILNSERMLRE
ncbi:PPM family protein phosphatase, partial [Candidatus Hakubella thermalkaliphila]